MGAVFHGEGRGVTLRRTLHVVIGLVAALLVATATALSVTTTLLHRTTEDAVEAVESVRVAFALELELMADRRALTLGALGGAAHVSLPGAQGSARLSRLLVEARRHAPSREEAALVDQAQAAVAAYFAAVRAAPPTSVEAIVKLEPRLTAAFVALDAIVWFNIDGARASTAEAARWDRLADVLGVAVAALALAGAGALLVGLRSQMIRALEGLHGAVGRFMGGDAGARAPERGAREVRELASSFNRMADTLARQEHDRLGFLSGLARDLRNPLTVVRLLVQPGGWAGPEEGARERAHGAAIDRQIQRMDRILRDLIDGALIASGRLDLRLAPDDLRARVADAVDAFQAQSPEHRFDVSLPEGPVIVACDAARIEHLLANLLSNAVKYSPPGSRVSVSLREAQGCAVLAVADEGVGMSSAQQAHAFEPFGRTSGSRGAVTGAGLGLAATKRIVEAHGGAIEVASAPRAGSTFRVTLPLAPKDPP